MSHYAVDAAYPWMDVNSEFAGRPEDFESSVLRDYWAEELKHRREIDWHSLSAYDKRVIQFMLESIGCKDDPTTSEVEMLRWIDKFVDIADECGMASYPKFVAVANNCTAVAESLIRTGFAAAEEMYWHRREWCVDGWLYQGFDPMCWVMSGYDTMLKLVDPMAAHYARAHVFEKLGERGSRPLTAGQFAAWYLRGYAQLLQLRAISVVGLEADRLAHLTARQREWGVIRPPTEDVDLTAGEFADEPMLLLPHLRKIDRMVAREIRKRQRLMRYARHHDTKVKRLKGRRKVNKATASLRRQIRFRKLFRAKRVCAKVGKRLLRKLNRVVTQSGSQERKSVRLAKRSIRERQFRAMAALNGSGWRKLVGRKGRTIYKSMARAMKGALAEQGLGETNEPMEWEPSEVQTQSGGDAGSSSVYSFEPVEESATQGMGWLPKVAITGLSIYMAKGVSETFRDLMGGVVHAVDEVKNQLLGVVQSAAEKFDKFGKGASKLIKAFLATALICLVIYGIRTLSVNSLTLSILDTALLCVMAFCFGVVDGELICRSISRLSSDVCWLFKSRPDNWQNVPSATQTQSVSSLLGPVVSVVFAFSVLGGKLKGREMSEFVKRVSLIERTSSGFEQVGEWVISAFETCFNTARKMLGKSAVSFRQSAYPALNKWCRDCDDLCLKMETCQTEIGAEEIDRLVELFQIGYGMRDVFRFSNLASKVEATLSRLHCNLVPLQGSLCARNLYRVEPLMVMLLGDAGIGKTTLAPFVCGAILKLSGLIKEGEDVLKQIWQKGPSKYWESYAGQICMVMDDAFQRLPTKGDEVNEFLMIIQMIGTWAMPLDFANLAAKGKNFFRSKLVFGTTNVTNLQQQVSSVIYSVDAIYRRLSNSYKLYLNPEYIREGRLDYAKFESELAELKRQSKVGMDSFPWHIWYVKKFDYATTTEGDAEPLRGMVERMASILKQRQDTFVENKEALQSFFKGFSEVPQTLGVETQSGGHEEVNVEFEEFERIQEADTVPLLFAYKEQRSVKFGNGRCARTLSRVDEGAIFVSCDRVGGNALITVPIHRALGIKDKVSMVIKFADKSKVDVKVVDLRLDALTGHYNYSEVKRHVKDPKLASALCEAIRQVVDLATDRHNSGIRDVVCCALNNYEVGAPTFGQMIDLSPQSIDIDEWCKKISDIRILVGLGMVIAGAAWLIRKIMTSGVQTQSAHSNSPPQPKRVEAQSGMTEHHKKIVDNVYNISFVDLKGSLRSIGSLIFVAGKIATFPAHYQANVMAFLSAGEITQDSVVKFVNVNKKGVLEMKVSQFLSYCSAGFAQGGGETWFAEFPSARPHANLSTVTIRETDIRAVGGNAGRLDVSFRGSEGQLESCSYQFPSIAGPKRFEFRETYGKPGAEVEHLVVMERCWKYTAATTRGDCGSPLMLANVKAFGGRYLCGYHVAGGIRPTGSSPAYSVVLTAEMINTAKERFSAVASNSLLNDIQHAIEEDLQLQGIGYAPTDELPFGALNGISAAEAEHCFYPVCKVESKYATNCPRVSSYEKSPIYDQAPFGPCPVRPAKLGPYLDGDVLVDPMDSAISAYSTPCVDLDLKDAELVAGVAFSPLFACTKDVTRIVYDFETAVLGDHLCKFRSVPRGTSSGWPFSCVNSNGKKEFFGYGAEYDLSGQKCAMLKLRVKTIIEDARKGIRRLHVFTDSLKDELRPHAKVDAGKTRAISAAPVDYLIAVRMMFGCFCAAVMRNHTKSGMAPGICPYRDWHALAMHLQDKGPRVFDGDFKGFDTSLMPKVFDVLLETINRWYGDGEENARVRKVLWLDLVNSFHIGGSWRSRGVIYEWSKCMPSGHPLTTIVNSMYSLFAIVYCYGILAKERGLSVASFWDVVSPITYGDDNVVNVADGVAPWFNQETLAGALKKHLCMTYTSADKDSTVWRHDMTIYDVSFLKRRFAVSANSTLCPLELDSFLFSCYYVKDKKSINSNMVQTLNMGLLELAHHPHSVWDKYAPKLIELIYEFGGAPMVGDSKAAWLQKSMELEVYY